MSDLKIDVELVRKILAGFIREEVHKVGFERVVLGLSGGADSSLVAFLAAEALGHENVWGLLMPYKTSSRESVEHAELVVAKTGINSKLIDIAPMVDAYFEKCATDAGNLQRGNKMARERMTILYDHSVQLKALVIGTGNKSELMVGYCTLHGDMACALNPLGDLYKTQVWQLAEAVGVPQEIIGKAPSADLWHGQTDEGELGFTYSDLDQLLYLMVDRRFSNQRLIEHGFDKGFVEQVASMVQNSQFKRKPPIIAKLTRRTVDSDFRYARDWGR